MAEQKRTFLNEGSLICLPGKSMTFLQKQTEKLSYLPDLQRAPPRHSLRVWTGRRKRPEERTYPQWRTNSQIKCRF